MQQLSVSVVVVSRGRPQSLCLTLTGLSRLYHSNYEIIVVADPEGIAAAQQLEFASDLQLIPYDKANISAARNLGINASNGDLVAFIDDDAVPEPTWLDHLTAPFSAPEVAAAGGFVIGRNGISWQWKARSVDQSGEFSPLNVDETTPTVLHPPQGRAVKTEGTNMAVRRRVLKNLNGFDEGFRFYLDETDLNMRLAQLGFATAIVPLAVVHHAYAPSARRRASRAVLDLTDVGRSAALFWRKHAPETEWPTYRLRLRQEQRHRLLAQMRDGLLEPGDVRHALSSLERGLAEGVNAPMAAPAQISRPLGKMHRFATRAKGNSVTLHTNRFGLNRCLQRASDLAEQGQTVSVYCFMLNATFHKVRFKLPGVWVQYGGQFGKSTRTQPLLRFWRRSKRAQAEQRRVAAYREKPNK